MYVMELYVHWCVRYTVQLMISITELYIFSAVCVLNVTEQVMGRSSLYITYILLFMAVLVKVLEYFSVFSVLSSVANFCS